jgi:hypothetical protein
VTAYRHALPVVNLKKGRAELIILSIVEPRARTWIRDQQVGRDPVGRATQVPRRITLSAPVPLEERGWLPGRWVEKSDWRRRFTV